MEEEINDMDLIQNKLILLASRPGIGRTTLALNIINKILKRDIAALIFTLGITKEESIRNDIDDINGLYIDYTVGVSIEQVKEKCLKMKKENNVKFVVIDDVHFVVGDKHKVLSRAKEIKDIMQQLKKLSEELKITILVTTQLNSTADRREEHRPILTDLENKIGQMDSADVMMFLYRDNYYNKESRNDITELIIVKNDVNNKLSTLKLKWKRELNRYE